MNLKVTHARNLPFAVNDTVHIRSGEHEVFICRRKNPIHEIIHHPVVSFSGHNDRTEIHIKGFSILVSDEFLQSEISLKTK